MELVHTPREAERRPPSAGRPSRERRGHYVTLGLTLWTILGLYLDVWSHGQSVPESFFSPYHALFYSGFIATAAWILRPLLRPAHEGTGAMARGPRGRDLGVVGVATFAIGGLGDMAWHFRFGAEKGIEALTSPPHLALLVGLILIASGPFRAAWAGDDRTATSPSLRGFMPALLSLTLSMLLVSMATIHLWGFASAHYMTPVALDRFAEEFARTPRGVWMVREITQQRGVGNILLTNVILLAPVLLLIRRWSIPFGSVTVMYSLVGLLMAAVTGSAYPLLLAVPVIAGLATDVLVKGLRPSTTRRGALRALATVSPIVTWSLYFLATHLEEGIAWPPGLWLGTILWTGVSGLALSVVAVPGPPDTGI